MTKRQQLGFGIIELILLLLLLILLILLGWYVYQANNKPAQSPQQSQQSQQSKDEMAGWKEYCSPLEKGCFKYPPNWTFQKDPNSYPNEEFMQAISPAGTKVVWGADITGVGGSCDPTTEPHVFINEVKPVLAVADLYVTGTGHVAGKIEALGVVKGNGQAPTQGDTGDCLYIHLFKSKDNTRQMWLSTGDVKPGDQATVEKILTSYHY